MRHRLSLQVLFVVVLGLLSLPGGTAAAAWNVSSNPIDPSQLTGMPWGFRSYWLQPWRSELVTRSALSFEDALGINFKLNSVGESEATARLLAENGIRRARVEFGWNGMSESDPSQLAPQWSAWLAQQIAALRDNGIRPLILLDSNSAYPMPMRQFNLTLAAPAAVGARSVVLSSASAAQVVPGLTGINAGGIAAGVLITAVDSSDVATLSRVLPSPLSAGSVAASTLSFAPFAPPYLADGSPNPRFQQTLAGWLEYVKAVATFVKQAYGSDDFDVEVWNELSSGSQFLGESNYYNPVPDPGATGSVTDALLDATIQMLYDPANGLTDVKVGDGFSNQTPFASGATVPAGTAALDKHPYAPLVNLPGASVDNASIKPVNALGQPDYKVLSPTTFQDFFTPAFRVFMPEYYLEGIQTETLMRDLSPMQSMVQGTPHGAGTHPPGGAPPAMWITEDNMDATQATTSGLPAADLPDFQAKAALRIYAAYGGEGAQAIDLFGAGKKSGPCCQLISEGFFDAVDASPNVDHTSLEGLPMQAIGRMTATLAGAEPIAQPRQLTLTAIAQDGDDSQFTGNGTGAFPTLYNRDVLAFFPFQVSQNKFVAAVYVMTSDLTHYYTAFPAPGYTPYDLPAESYQLTIGNVDGPNASVSLTDPLTGQQQPATIVSRSASQIVVQLQATDSPRMLTIQDAPSTTLTTTTVITPTTSTTTAQPQSGSAQAAVHATKASPGLVLKAPRRVAATSARRDGIKLGVRCSRACAVNVTAVQSGSHRIQVVAQTRAQIAGGKNAELVLRMTAFGRRWLRALRATARLRITAVTTGSRSSMTIGVSKIKKRKTQPKRTNAHHHSPTLADRRRRT